MKKVLLLALALGPLGCSFDRISCANEPCPRGLVCDAEKQCVLPPEDGGTTDASD